MTPRTQIANAYQETVLQNPEVGLATGHYAQENCPFAFSDFARYFSTHLQDLICLFFCLIAVRNPKLIRVRLPPAGLRKYVRTGRHREDCPISGAMFPERKVVRHWPPT